MSGQHDSTEDAAIRLVRAFYSEGERPMRRLRAELAEAAELVSRSVSHSLTWCQKAALLSLAADLCGRYADGLASFKTSDLVCALNRGDMQIAAASFFKFSSLGGRMEPRLWKRRDSEQKFFRTGVI